MPAKSVCAGCGKAYANAGLLKRHQNGCRDYSNKLDSVNSISTSTHASQAPGWHRVVNLPIFPRSWRRRKRKRQDPPSLSDEGDDMDVDPSQDVVMDEFIPDAVQSRPASPGATGSIQAPNEELSRAQRSTRGNLPARYVDMLPLGTAPPSDIDDLDSNGSPAPDIPPPFLLARTARRARISVQNTLRSARNALGLSRLYTDRPQTVPNEFAPLSDGSHPLVDGSESRPDGSDSVPRTVEEIISPYPNFSSFLFNDWFWRRRQKSKEDRRDLQRNVLHHPEFRSDDLRGVNFDAIDRKLASNGTSHASLGHGWRSSTIHLRVPHGLKRKKSSRQRVIDPELCIYDIHGVLNRSIPQLIEDVFDRSQACKDTRKVSAVCE